MALLVKGENQRGIYEEEGSYELKITVSLPGAGMKKALFKRRLNHVVGPNTCRGDITDLPVFVGIPSILKQCG